MSKDHVQDMLMEHFMNPRNVGELPDANGVGEVTNPICGDIIRLFLVIDNGKIQKATFKSVGCRAAIATSSILTGMVVGKSVPDALAINKEDIANVLGNLPPLKKNCAKLAEFALKAALGDYQARSTSDRSLADQIYDRIHDPQEWRVNAAFDGTDEALAGMSL